ncbi:MAG TPA: GNAT family N-acetyltransferase [Tepidiformaceae bacterium]|nr:GNAT family N-acetyltransferase [Tepidiformaceae bacterium]
MRTVDDTVAGRVRLRSDSDGALFIEQLEVEPDLRGYGLGSEAARLVLDGAAAVGYQDVQAWAPPDRGLAVYFWFRMGLRPLFGAGPGGGLRFVRGRVSEYASR